MEVSKIFFFTRIPGEDSHSWLIFVRLVETTNSYCLETTVVIPFLSFWGGEGCALISTLWLRFVNFLVEMIYLSRMCSLLSINSWTQQVEPWNKMFFLALLVFGGVVVSPVCMYIYIYMLAFWYHSGSCVARWTVATFDVWPRCLVISILRKKVGRLVKLLHVPSVFLFQAATWRGDYFPRN